MDEISHNLMHCVDTACLSYSCPVGSIGDTVKRFMKVTLVQLHPVSKSVDELIDRFIGECKEFDVPDSLAADVATIVKNNINI